MDFILQVVWTSYLTSWMFIQWAK